MAEKQKTINLFSAPAQTNRMTRREFSRLGTKLLLGGIVTLAVGGVALEIANAEAFSELGQKQKKTATKTEDKYKTLAATIYKNGDLVLVDNETRIQIRLVECGVWSWQDGVGSVRLDAVRLNAEYLDIVRDADIVIARGNEEGERFLIGNTSYVIKCKEVNVDSSARLEILARPLPH